MLASGAVRERKGTKEKVLKIGNIKNQKKQPGSSSSSVKPKPKREVDEKTCCYRCGGLGHVARMLMDDGSTLECATSITIPNDILNKMTYPHIPTALERRNAYKSKKGGAANEVAEEEVEEPAAEEEVNSEDEEGQYANLLEQNDE